MMKKKIENHGKNNADILAKFFKKKSFIQMKFRD